MNCFSYNWHFWWKYWWTRNLSANFTKIPRNACISFVICHSAIEFHAVGSASGATTRRRKSSEAKFFHFASLLRPREYYDAYMSPHITRKPHGRAELHHFVHIASGRGSVRCWQHCDMLCTSGFVDDVMFSRSWPYGGSCIFLCGEETA